MIKCRQLLPVLALLFLAFGEPALAQGSGKSFPGVATDNPPIIDGVLDDAVWKLAEPISDFHQIEPTEFGRPFQRTEVRVLFDEKNLYIGARLEYDDIENELTAQTMVQVSRIFSDDRFSIILDPFLDRRNGYYFEINANGGTGRSSFSSAACDSSCSRDLACSSV